MYCASAGRTVCANPWVQVFGGALLALFSFALLSSSFQMFLCETLVELQANKLVVLVRHAGTSVVGYLFINLPSLL